jgi:hypothetical protein
LLCSRRRSNSSRCSSRPELQEPLQDNEEGFGRVTVAPKPLVGLARAVHVNQLRRWVRQRHRWSRGVSGPSPPRTMPSRRVPREWRLAPVSPPGSDAGAARKTHCPRGRPGPPS